MESFGRYQLVSKLGVGGMAEIFLARSASLDGFEKELAIKRIRPELGSEEKFFSLFIDEARISISLSHPNVVQVFDFGEVQGTYYLAMEYVQGCDLARLCITLARKGKALEAPIALLVMGEVLKGLDYAHNRKTRDGEPLHVVHRDVSPQNIMLSFDGNVKLTDFGIAKARGRMSETNPGMVLGKLAYMAPEQLRGDEVDRRVDVFACGVVLWEMLVGASLFGAQVRSGLYDKILEAEIEPPSRRRPEIPAELDRLVMRAVSKDPGNRYSSAREFGSEVHSYLVRHHPDVNLYNLQSFLETFESELRGPATKPLPVNPPTLILPKMEHKTQIVPEVPAREFEWSDTLIAVIEAFHKRPSLWHLVRMGEICVTEQQHATALACFRVAAVKFAQRGLLAQALFACRKMLECATDRGAVMADVARYAALVGKEDAEVAPLLFTTSGPVEELLRELLAEAKPGHNDVGQATPLLGNLDGRTFAELVVTAPLVHFDEGKRIVEQGQNGTTMYLVARGRVLVYATAPSGQRVYLSSLTAGDFFGENGFFTGAPRSAHVEALYPVAAFEIDRALYARVTANNPDANAVLLRFYKERIAETVMAKSPIFGLLNNEDRRAIVAKFTPRTFLPSELVIKEGALSAQIYLVKDGYAEVFTDRNGTRTTLSRLGPGTIFGEIAALKSGARTASVAASGKLEVLELSAADFLAVLDAQPELRRRVEKVAAERGGDQLPR